jgi:hypothetical protein
MRELNGASMVFLCPPEPGDSPKRDNPGARDLDMEPIGRKRWAIAEGAFLSLAPVNGCSKIWNKS